MAEREGRDWELEKEREFLDALARRLGKERGREPVLPSFSHVAGPRRPVQEIHHEALVQQFVQNLQQLDTTVRRAKRGQLPDLLREAVETYGIQSYVCWEDERLEELGIPGALSALSLENREKEPEKADAGITMADLGIAETGTLVLFNGGRKRRITSLLPYVYIPILSSANIVPRITQVLAKISEIHRTTGALPACVNLITGPSRSADIEMSLSLGVHGPGRVFAILLDD